MLFPCVLSQLRLPQLLAALTCLALPYAQGDALLVVTEELPPYNMTVDGHLTGMGTEVVEATLREAGVSAPIQSMPWARAYDLALHGNNVLIYSMARIPEREALFNWIGAIAPTRWYLYTFASRPVTLKTLEDAKVYQCGVVKADVGELYLIARGFQNGINLQSSNRRELNYEKLKSGHIDLWIANELNARWLTKQSGDDPNRTLVQALPLTDIGGEDGLYMALSLKTPQPIVERLRQALQRIHENGTYAAIARKWL